MSTERVQATFHSLGPAVYESPHATFEYKAASPRHTGGGYPRWRSWEERPNSARQGKEDVFVPIHRLCAVAWLFPDDWSAEDILASGHLKGTDVHHGLGMPAANVDPASPNADDGDGLQIRSHGGHSSITQAQMRAWAADAKDADAEAVIDEANRCARCDAEADVLCDVPSYDAGTVCLECSQDVADGGEIRVV